MQIQRDARIGILCVLHATRSHGRVTANAQQPGEKKKLMHESRKMRLRTDNDQWVLEAGGGGVKAACMPDVLVSQDIVIKHRIPCKLGRV